MFDPFPTFPLPPCNASGGPPMETTDDDPGGAFAFNAVCNRIILSALDDGHHEGDPAPVIGWGESVRRVSS